MLQIHTEYVEDVPVLNIVKSDRAEQALPTLIFLHGYTSSKEQNLSYAYLLGQKGFRVLLPDAPLHGERELPHSVEKRQWQFWDIVMQGINELKVIVEYYISEQKIDPERVCVAGTSMGSITMFGALTQYDWIKAGVSMMGTPSYVRFANMMLEQIRKGDMELPVPLTDLEQKVSGLNMFDLSETPERLGDRRLWIWHGEADSVVPYNLTRAFYDKLLHDGYVKEDQVHMVTDPIAGHKVTRDACHQAVQWVSENV
ncbi:alpha/beta fold hydrolase [Pseudalkalibacillus sp. SCS-8]|uniref:alpha/beta fold hydrolase n=1 Tax=Pseudalkalibacillus nanhaiensis TaxID=3115291 RepID=UPI0032DBAC3C